MAGTIQLRVLTDTGTALEDEAVSIRAPAQEGSIGFLYNHAPLVETFSPGKLIWKRPTGETRELMLEDGMLEIVRNRCTILTRAIRKDGVPPGAVRLS